MIQLAFCLLLYGHHQINEAEVTAWTASQPAMRISRGSTEPAPRLPGRDDVRFSRPASRTYRGKWLILFSRPADFTRRCCGPSGLTHAPRDTFRSA